MRIEWIGDDKDQAFVTRGLLFRYTAHLKIVPDSASGECPPAAYGGRSITPERIWVYVETGRPCAFSNELFKARECALNQALTELEWVRVRSRPRRTLRLLPQVKAPKSERLIKP